MYHVMEGTGLWNGSVAPRTYVMQKHTTEGLNKKEITRGILESSISQRLEKLTPPFFPINHEKQEKWAEEFGVNQTFHHAS
jgi:hypothetical protein